MESPGVRRSRPDRSGDRAEIARRSRGDRAEIAAEIARRSRGDHAEITRRSTPRPGRSSLLPSSCRQRRRYDHRAPPPRERTCRIRKVHQCMHAIYEAGACVRAPAATTTVHPTGAPWGRAAVSRKVCKVTKLTHLPPSSAPPSTRHRSIFTSSAITSPSPSGTVTYRDT